LVSILSILVNCDALKLNCEYQLVTWAFNPNSYTCKATVLFLGHERNVQEVSKNHLAGKTNNDVKGLLIVRQISVDFIPQNLNSFFPNIKLISLHECGLKTISSFELKQFGSNLEVFATYENFIEQIDHNLFEFNPAIVFVTFRGNRIRHIGYDAFEMTPLLASLELTNNFCISKSITNATAIRDFKFELALKCPPTVAMLEAQLFSRQKFETKIDAQVSERINPLVLRVYRLEQQNQQYEHDNAELKERIAKIEQQIGAF
jgi:hypothetical protein